MNKAVTKEELINFILDHIKLSMINKYSSVRKQIIRYIKYKFPKPKELTPNYKQLNLFEDSIYNENRSNR